MLQGTFSTNLATCSRRRQLQPVQVARSGDFRGMSSNPADVIAQVARVVKSTTVK